MPFVVKTCVYVRNDIVCETREEAEAELEQLQLFFPEDIHIIEEV
ncbi:MAG: hypothetical protein AB1330_01785 [Bacillota bacterium]